MGKLPMSNWVAWSPLAGKNNMEKERGVGAERQVKSECAGGFGLVWFGLVLVLVLVVAGPGWQQ